MAGRRVLFAIGGNSLIKDNAHLTVEDQYKAISETTSQIADIVEEGNHVVISHGNGPQVGFILRRSEIAQEVAQMHSVPLVSCDADTQGAIGYQIQQSLDNDFRKRNMKQQAVTIITQIRVDEKDPAFLNPAKPIGRFYSAEEYRLLSEVHPDWQMTEDAGRGYRRMVPSPIPKEIIELQPIRSLYDQNYVLIAAGGGGIPVVEDQGQIRGVDAVIDKDRASALLAAELDVEVFVISTGVSRVCINFGKENQQELEKVSAEEIHRYLLEGHFAPGSMAPKIEAALEFLERGGREVIITDPEHLSEAFFQGAGTHITGTYNKEGELSNA